MANPDNSSTRSPRSPGSASPAASGDLGPLVQQFGPKLQEEFDELATHESRMMQLLSEPVLHARFLQDPVGTLESHGIPVGPTIRLRLKRLINGAPPEPPVINLPNGQVLTPKLTIRITGRQQKPDARVPLVTQ
jgi:hypothetical protein